MGVLRETFKSVKKNEVPEFLKGAKVKKNKSNTSKRKTKWK